MVSLLRQAIGQKCMCGKICNKMLSISACNSFPAQTVVIEFTDRLGKFVMHNYICC